MVAESSSGIMIHGSNVHDCSMAVIAGSVQGGPQNGVMDCWSIGVLGSRCMIPLLHNSGTPIPVLQSLSSRVARRGRMLRPQRLHESDEGGHLLRREVLAIGRHVAAALNHLPDQLVRG